MGQASSAGVGGCTLPRSLNASWGRIQARFGPSSSAPPHAPAMPVAGLIPTDQPRAVWGDPYHPSPPREGT